MSDDKVAVLAIEGLRSALTAERAAHERTKERVRALEAVVVAVREFMRVEGDGWTALWPVKCALRKLDALAATEAGGRE